MKRSIVVVAFALLVAGFASSCTQGIKPDGHGHMMQKEEPRQRLWPESRYPADRDQLQRETLNTSD